MLDVLYEDREIIVVKKPAGVDAQARHSLEPDMVSLIRSHIRGSLSGNGEPYVGVVQRLDKPVPGIMVYAKSRPAAAALSAQIQAGRVRKIYRAVVCGRCADDEGRFVDHLLKDARENRSRIVEKGTKGAKRAELRYRVLGVLDGAEGGDGPLTLVEIELLTGRHHQIRVQFAGHGLPLWGDARYGSLPAGEQSGDACYGSLPAWKQSGDARYGSLSVGERSDDARYGSLSAGERSGGPVSRSLALCACGLCFAHPVTGKGMSFSITPEAPIFRLFGPCPPAETAAPSVVTVPYPSAEAIAPNVVTAPCPPAGTAAPSIGTVPCPSAASAAPSVGTAPCPSGTAAAPNTGGAASRPPVR